MRTDIESRIRDDAAEDPAFREALLADADSALRERYGFGAPEGFGLRVIEESPDEIVLVLPHVRDGVTLADSDLDAAAGGGPTISSTFCW